jgi:hypothetical protein
VGIARNLVIHSFLLFFWLLSQQNFHLIGPCQGYCIEFSSAFSYFSKLETPFAASLCIIHISPSNC